MTKSLLTAVLALTIATTSGMAFAQGGKTTETLERTTTKTYTVTKQKVGMIGNRPYPVETTTVDGGVKVEEFVNGQKVDEKVLEPDPMLDSVSDTIDQMDIRQYYANEEGMKWYGDTKLDIKVRPVGRLND